MPMSEAFSYLLYTLIKLYYTKALSNQALSLAPDRILLLWRPRILASFRGSATAFQFQDNFQIVASCSKENFIPSDVCLQIPVKTYLK